VFRSKTLVLVTVLFLGILAAWLVLKSNAPLTRSFNRVLDVNHASSVELDQVPYLTLAMAEGIVSGRPWRSIDALTDVSGIGDKTLERIRPHLKLKESR